MGEHTRVSCRCFDAATCSATFKRATLDGTWVEYILVCAKGGLGVMKCFLSLDVLEQQRHGPARLPSDSS